MPRSARNNRRGEQELEQEVEELEQEVEHKKWSIVSVKSWARTGLSKTSE